MSEALVHPVWLPPRTTLGAPSTMKSPAWAAARAVFSLTGNSAILAPCERKRARIAGLSSSCETIRTLASRAAWASLAIDAGTSCARETTRATSWSKAWLDRPVRSTMRLRFLRFGNVADRGLHMVVKREQVDAAFRHPFGNFGFGVEIV